MIEKERQSISKIRIMDEDYDIKDDELRKALEILTQNQPSDNESLDDDHA